MRKKMGFRVRQHLKILNPDHLREQPSDGWVQVSFFLKAVL